MTSKVDDSCRRQTVFASFCRLLFNSSIAKEHSAKRSALCSDYEMKHQRKKQLLFFSSSFFFSCAQDEMFSVQHVGLLLLRRHGQRQTLMFNSAIVFDERFCLD